MTPTREPRPRAQSAGPRQARLARVRMIRHRVVAGSLALFVATWLLITMVLVSGNDPALAAHKSTASVSSASTTPTTTTTPTTSATSTTSTPATSSSSSTSSSGVSSVTSSQS
jgi:cytoskeletal protein RodZ